MSALGDATEAYGHYLNARPRAVEHFDADALAEYDADLAKAKAQMERAWLESKPTLPEDH